MVYLRRDSFSVLFNIDNRIIKTDDTIDRTQGSTHLPEFPCVSMQKPAEYQRTLTLNDVSKIRFVKRIVSLEITCIDCLLFKDHSYALVVPQLPIVEWKRIINEHKTISIECN